MNRKGLFAALAVAVVVGVVFGIHPQFDLDVTAPFYDRAANLFFANGQLWVSRSRDAARLVVVLLVAPAFLAAVGKLIMPQRRMLISGNAALFLAASLVVGPGLITTEVLKDHWGRVRPIDVTEFGGADRFTPWWDPRGACPNNCSFIAGEPSSAFWTLAPAALTPPQWRLLAVAAALLFGGGVGLLRIAGGAHFFTDVVFAGVITYLVAWTIHGLIYRWRRTRIPDGAIEHGLGRAGAAIGRAFAAATRRTGPHTDKLS